MKREQAGKDFEHYIDEYLYDCRSRGLREKTMSSYEQALYLFARWVREREGPDCPSQVREQSIRRYICELQERATRS